jgi:hypothetical protein
MAQRLSWSEMPPQGYGNDLKPQGKHTVLDGESSLCHSHPLSQRRGQPDAGSSVFCLESLKSLICFNRQSKSEVKPPVLGSGKRALPPGGAAHLRGITAILKKGGAS